MLVIQKKDRCNVDKKKGVNTALKRVINVMPEKPWGKLERAREYAFSLYEKRGYVLGNELKVWLEAERKIKKG